MRRTPVRIQSSCAAASSSSPYSTIFACSTFKDIQNLCSADTHSSRKPSVFHRARIATALLRSLSSSRQLQSRCSPYEPLSIANSTEPKHDTLEKTMASRSEQERISELENTLTASKYVRELKNDEDSVISSETICKTKSTRLMTLPGSEKRIVVYFTSLRVVRSTFEDCRTVRSILRWFPVSIDERDLSMDPSHLNELREILGENKLKLKLPRVFIAGKYIGGAEKIRQLHESGELQNLVAELPAAKNGVCDGCGGYRFVMCNGCSGSHKVYTEKSGFRSCTACNENGIIKCPTCSFAPF